ncbi:MAG: FAD-binding protein [Ideonella sp.]|nr:FAD-binding protein [Ideonella sp.]
MTVLEHDYDLLVVGSGAGALLGAIRAADLGLRTLVIEKTALVGGTSATSGGAIWVPCNHDMKRVGIDDDLATAFRYVKACARGQASDERILAYLETAPELARYLDGIGVKFRAMAKYADYYPAMAGARPGGRTMDPLDFNARRLGHEALEQLRPTNPGQLIFGRMQLNAFEARSILARERKAKFLLSWIMLRYLIDYPWRNKTRRDRRLTGGQALMGALFTALRQRGIDLWLEAPLQSLTTEGGRVTGAVVQRQGQAVTVRTTKGVLLGAGGFERNQAMREQYLPQPTDQAWTASPPGCNTGEAIQAGAEAGGALHLMDLTWGAPTLFVTKEDRYRVLFIERSLPGCLVVNAAGQRFVNESCAYLEFQQAMRNEHARMGGAIPAWIVFDAEFRRKYPIGPLAPGEAVPDERLRKSWLSAVYWKDSTLQGLAGQIGVDAAGLAASVARMNDFARSGVDPEFGRGGNVFDRYYGDVNVRPNPNLGAIGKPPFYAIRLWPGELGTKGGLLTDPDARVLDEQGRPIDGLYSVGNNAASVMGPAYPGAGSTLGPAMAFAYRAAARMAGQPIPLAHTELLDSPA